MLNILAQATELGIGGGLVAAGGLTVWIFQRIIYKRIDKVLDHPDDKTCHIDPRIIYNHLNKSDIHIPKNYLDARFDNVTTRLNDISNHVESVHQDIREMREAH